MHILIGSATSEEDISSSGCNGKTNDVRVLPDDEQAKLTYLGRVASTSLGGSGERGWLQLPFLNRHTSMTYAVCYSYTIYRTHYIPYRGATTGGTGERGWLQLPFLNRHTSVIRIYVHMYIVHTI